MGGNFFFVTLISDFRFSEIVNVYTLKLFDPSAMKSSKVPFLLLIVLLLSACGNKEKPVPKFILKRPREATELNIPINKGFSEYVSGYTSGIVSVNSVIEIRFTPEFAAKASKETPAGLFIFEPAIRGKAEWTDDLTLTFKPAKTLDPGTFYSGKLQLDRAWRCQGRAESIPYQDPGRIKKDFIVNTGALECNEDGTRYSLHGEIIASDYIASSEVESYLQAKTWKDEKGDSLGSLKYSGS